MLRDLLRRLHADRPRRSAGGAALHRRPRKEGIRRARARRDRDRRLAHQALHRRHRRAHDDRGDEVPRLLDLLHAREHRRLFRTDPRQRGEDPLRDRRGARHVGDRGRAPRPRDALLLPEPAGRARGPHVRPGLLGRGARLPERAVHLLPRHLLGLLDHVLAGLLLAAVLRDGRPEDRRVSSCSRPSTPSGSSSSRFR